ncbi:hypothetical protein EVC24_028 [Rhizobium phage RHph_I4]|nr:hypothetical protein EVC24_028 [Rhizobium phage RHph_I4]
MRYVRLDDEEDRKSVAEVKAKAEAERKRQRLLDATAARERKQREIAEAKEEKLRLAEARREEAKLQRALARENTKEQTRVEVMAARKSHQSKDAPDLRALAEKDYWTPEDLAYVRYYFGSSAWVSGITGRLRNSFAPITLYGHIFEWNGVRYARTRPSDP